MNTEILKDNDAMMVFIAQLVAGNATQMAICKSENRWEVSYKPIEEIEEPAVS